MIPSPIEPPLPPLDARWIIALWVAIHGVRPVPDAGGELTLEPEVVRAVATNAIRALASQFDSNTAEAVAAALGALPSHVPALPSDAQVEESLKRFGIRLYDARGLVVAGFGKVAWR